MLKAKHGFSFVVAAISVLLLVACGDDNSTKASDKIVVDSVEDLSNCVATKVGNLEYVDTVAYVCVEFVDMITWIQVSEVEDDPEDFKVCTEKKEGQYSLSPKENTLYACNGEEWISVKQLDDNDSMEESSSSEASVKGVNPADVIVGSMTDSRDGQTYKTVTIGTQTWMAQNLNYAYTDVPYKRGDYTSDSTSWCYNNDANNCSKYGRLYTWAAAMDSVGTWSTSGKGCGFGTTCSPTYPVRGVCPEGWHLPTEEEFETLFTAVGGQSTAGKVLKSTSGWNSGNGSDVFAFSALPAGLRNNIGYYNNEGGDALFWSSTEDGSGSAYYMYLTYNVGDSYLSSYKFNGFSVRCLKDEGTTLQSSSSTKISSSSVTQQSSSSKKSGIFIEQGH